MILTQWKITMKYLLFISLILFCSCHSGSSRKGQREKTDSIRLQKELYALHRYVDSIIKSDTILQQHFHCSGVGLTKDKVSIDFQDIPEDSFEVFKSAFKKNVFDSPLLEFNIMSDITFGPEIIPIKEDSLGRTTNIVLSPIPRDIPSGEAINPDSLSMRVEYDYYPLSTTEVKVIITNHSRYEYDCGEGYSLVYYNEKQKTWETLPTNLIRNDILWIFPSNCPTHEQTIRLYTSEVPNRPGKYRIYKSFNGNTKVAYAGFKMVDKKGIEQIRKRISEYNMKNRDTIAQNITDFGSYGDTIEVSLINNSSYFQEMFRRKVVSYSAVSHGKIQQPELFTSSAYSDTLQISMKTEKSVYPVGVKSVSVNLVNNNSKALSFGGDYRVARRENGQWILLYGNFNVKDEGIIIKQGGTYQFAANLYPLFNDNKSGVYRVYKRVGFDNSREDWFMSAEFRIK